MAFRQKFLAGLVWRFGLLLLSAFALVIAIRLPGYTASAIVSGLLCLAALVSLWRHVQRTNVELARFIATIRFGDLSPGFSNRSVGSGFAEVGVELEQAMQRLREERGALADASRFYEAVLDDAPVALLTVDQDARVVPANKAARRLFNRHRGTGIEAFAEYGNAFVQCLIRDPGSGPRLVPLMIDGIPQAAMVSAAAVHRLDGLVHAVAVQPIQSELNAVELSAQSDLIRVLTHEIMNSMTPVTSLAHSAVALMETADREGGGRLAEARMAVETLARRADGLMHFVESYRQISRTPQIHRRRFALLGWARELESLFRASDVAEGVDLSCSVEPPDLSIDADPDLLSQVLINLLRNGAQAAIEGSARPAVSLRFSATKNGSTQIEIADNGPGIPPEMAHDIFLPFFTTREAGTGVGLSVARQLVHAHRGSISMKNSPQGGASFRILI